MNTTTKITKRACYDAILAVFTGNELPEGITAEDIVNFCEDQKTALDNKAAKAKEYAAKKKAAGDALTETVFGVLTDEPATVDEITEAVNEIVNDENLTRQKVAYRLNALAKDGRATKGEVTVAGSEGKKSHKIVVYSR